MKKYVFVVPSLSSGGAERVVSVLASEIAKTDRDVTIIKYYQTDREYPISENVKVVNLSGGYESDYHKIGFASKIKMLRNCLKKEKADYIIPFLPHVCAHTSFAAIGVRGRVIQTVRNNPASSPEGRKARFIRDLLINLSSLTIVQNEQQKKYFPKRIHKKISVLYNPITESLLELSPCPDGKDFRFVAVGRLIEQKNFSMLIDAMQLVKQECPNAVLSIYGSGSLYHTLQEQINSKKMQDVVTLEGRCEDMPSAYLSANAFVMSSDFEGMPNALMEAMAVGLPCISTNCPTGPSDLIENEVSGLLVPVGDKEAMAQAMIRIYSKLDSDKKFGEKAKTFISDTCRPATIAKQLISYCE